MKQALLGFYLEEAYSRFNTLDRLCLDPLAIVLRYSDDEDREIAGLVCSTLAFGSVELIMDACERALQPLGPHPAKTLRGLSDARIGRIYSEFQYRFCFPKDMQALLRSIRNALLNYGSLCALFVAGDPHVGAASLGPAPATRPLAFGSPARAPRATSPGAPGNSSASGTRPIVPALSAFVRALRELGAPPAHSLGRRYGSDTAPAVRALGAPAAPAVVRDSNAGIRRNLLPDPVDGSACKRLFLYLRWMVRKDEVDPGSWQALSPAPTGTSSSAASIASPAEPRAISPSITAAISPARLVVPMDVHMSRLCRTTLGFLPPAREGSQPNLRDALAVTSAFARYSLEDPVKYDFALTRPGIDPRPGDEGFALTEPGALC